MTVVVAVARDGVVVMAADTGMTLGDVVTAAPPKISRYGDALVGFAGTVECLPRLRHLDVPDNDDLDVWAQDVAEAVTALLLTAAPPLTIGDAKDTIACDLILARAGRMWSIDTNLATSAGPVVAIGSGSDVAHGYATAALSLGADPAEAVEDAVIAACERLASCHLVGGLMQIERLAA